MSMVFRYIDTSNPDGTVHKRPAIPILFSNGERKYEMPALIDSGADMSAIDSRWASWLNLDMSGKRTKSFGVGGSVETVVSNVSIDVSKGHEHYALNIPVRVLMLGESDPYAPTLIGRKGFFEQFKITIDESSQKVVLKNNCELSSQ